MTDTEEALTAPESELSAAPTGPGAPGIRHCLAILVLLGLVLGAAGVFNHGLWTADEPRVAEIGREMWQARSPAVPRLNGEAFLEKPPLYWWVQAGIFTVAGRATAGLARLASALLAFGALLATFWLGRRWLTARETLLGCLVLLTTVMFIMRSHWIVVDNALALAVTGAFAAFAASLSTRGARRGGALALFYVCLAAGFLTKGAIGLGIPALGVLVYLVSSRRFRDWIGWHLAGGALLVTGAAALWLAAVWRDAGPEAVRRFLLVNQLGRFLPSATGYTGGHQNPFWYYLGTFPADFLPWTPLLVAALVVVARRFRSLPDRHREAARFFLATSVPAFLVLSVAGTKRGLYLFPIFPPLALLTGMWLASAPGPSRWERRTLRITGACIVGLAFLLGVGSLAAPFFVPSDWPRAIGGVLAFGLVATPIIRSLRRAPADGGWVHRSALFALGTATALVVALPAIDATKGFTPFTSEVNRIVPADARLLAVDPDETTLGVVGFYTGRRLQVVPTPEDLPEALDGRDAWVVLRGNLRDVPRDLSRLEAQGLKYTVLSRRRVGDRRVMQLLRVRPPVLPDR